MMSNPHKAGFVSIVGKPNVGKSTLMNRLVGENLSIITAKAQTTRHRIMGILSGEDFQIVYSDTPGLLDPKYELHKSMMNFVRVSLEDADLILLVVELGEKYDEQLMARFNEIKTPIILVINKIDLAKGSQLEDKIEYWKKNLSVQQIITVSAIKGQGVEQLLSTVRERLPEHPPYYPKDDLTNKSERFFASEIIREKIFLNYEQEVPYSTEVGIESFKEEEKIIRIRAIIYVERDSQKGIIIGKGGSSLKKVGIEARKDLETFFGKQVFLETHVKVADNWRKQKGRLKEFGYTD
ncbi:MAG TPA: GTPase Era [Cyclobacteriaceae bacterium]|nr:GTPase Era [Cyclobacteriaceae bacterium]HRW99476.1 GTPase Era [Cyclobacteriaceae bacterium]